MSDAVEIGESACVNDHVEDLFRFVHLISSIIRDTSLHHRMVLLRRAVLAVVGLECGKTLGHDPAREGAVRVEPETTSRSIKGLMRDHVECGKGVWLWRVMIEGLRGLG